MSGGASDADLGELEQAVAAEPANSGLRFRLAQAQLQAGRAAESLSNVIAVLGARPDDPNTAALAARAASAAGDDQLAERYRRLERALRADQPRADTEADGGVPGDARQATTIHNSVPDERRPIPSEADIDEADLDAFLRQVLADVERPSITLADVGGLEDVKHRLNTSFLAPLRNPELRAAFRKSLRGGLLLYGPPGCGKTFLAKAIAGELGARFVSIGLAEVLDMWFGQAVKNLHELFGGARRAAPCVVFLDEVDALGHKRANLARHASRDVVAQLLTELDGLAEDNEGVFVLGATNRPWDVDEALRRPGRFDRIMLVLPPDRDARQAILATQLRGRPVDDVDLGRVAARTERFSGADLFLVCESATEAAMEASAQAGAIQPITTEQLLSAAEGISPSTIPWFESARNYALYANQTGTYDDLLAYLRANRL